MPLCKDPSRLGVAAGAFHNLVLKTDGLVVGWGYNGNGLTTSPASATNVAAIAAGGYLSLAQPVP